MCCIACQASINAGRISYTAVTGAGHQIQANCEHTCLQGTLQCLAQHHLVRSGALHVVAIAAGQDAIHVPECLWASWSTRSVKPESKKVLTRNKIHAICT